MNEKERRFFTDGRRKFATNILERMFEIIFSVWLIGLVVYTKLHPEISLSRKETIIPGIILVIIFVIGFLVAPEKL